MQKGRKYLNVDVNCGCSKVYCFLSYETFIAGTARDRESSATSLKVREQQSTISCAPKLCPKSLPVPAYPQGCGSLPHWQHSRASPWLPTGPQPTWPLPLRDAQSWGSHHAPPGCPAFLLDPADGDQAIFGTCSNSGSLTQPHWLSLTGRRNS